MTEQTSPERTQQVERILAESERQVLQNASGKLRIVDVAAALGMSHANVYRFFKSRDALLGGLVDRWLKESEASAARALASDGPASESLRGFLVNLHLEKRARLASGPGVLGIYKQAMEKRADAIPAHRAFLVDTAITLLKRGCDQGEYAIRPDQIPAAAIVLEAILAPYIHPTLVAESQDRDTVTELNAVLDMFIGSLVSAPDSFATL